MLQASVTGLQPGKPHLLALATMADGSGAVHPLVAFMTNPAGSAIVNAVGPIRQIVTSNDPPQRRHRVIAANDSDKPGTVQQVQQP